MGFSKNDFDKVDLRIKNITEQTVEQIEVDSELPPTIEQLEDNNKTYSIMAAILFIDIRKSTHLTENSQAKSMVKIYRSFMRMAVDCVRKNGGVTRQFLGDRIMGVFIDSIDKNGSIVDSAADKAINAARSLQTVIDYSLNKYLKTNVNGKVIECGIGIDYGKVLVTQVGMYGLESDENRENEVDCVWVGNTTNYASKYSDIASGGEIFISNNVFKQMSDEYREVFVKSAKYKGRKLFQGYVAKDYYLEFSEDLGKPIKIEEDTTVESDTFEGLADGIREIERLQDKLIQREKQLAVLEDKIKRENQDYEDKYNNENVAKLRAFDERDTAKKELQEILKDYYVDIKSILSKVHYREYQYMDKVGKKDLILMIEKEYELGRLLGKTSKEVSLELGCYLIGIYDYFQEYSKSFDVMLVMAELSDYWVDLETATLNWANKEHILYKLYNEIERALVNYRVKNERRKNFEGYLQTIKKIRGVLTMENNNNLTQENRAFKKGDAYETLGIINTWIGNMDTKVSFALALAGVLIGVIFEKGMPSAFERITEVSKLAELSGGEIIAAILVALLYLSSFISILCFMLSIIARVKNLNNAPSIFFFGSIGNMTLENYKSAVKDMDEKEMIDDLEEQIHTNSKICSLKAKWYNKGIKFLLATVILWFVCMIFQLI
ncbi:Pycsar system effector family protein [Agathobacter rectalis]|nr:Pycsar system effector family protein [Agathobacter rectalis]MDB8001505.1 DUF5706 domain-containing protein [Agathobacter rectalis]MDB8007468.1 DUF5706 domain-containing protein [Agathobacter rectalis]